MTKSFAVTHRAVIAGAVFDVPAGYFYETYVDELYPMDYISGLVKATTFGMLVGIIGCFQGFQTKFGTEAVGISTTNTVVATSVSIIIMDFILTMIFLPVGFLSFSVIGTHSLPGQTRHAQGFDA